MTFLKDSYFCPLLILLLVLRYSSSSCNLVAPSCKVTALWLRVCMQDLRPCNFIIHRPGCHKWILKSAICINKALTEHTLVFALGLEPPIT